MDRLQEAVNRLGRSISERTGHLPNADTKRQASLPLDAKPSTRRGLLFEPGVEPHRAFVHAQAVWLPSRQQAFYSGPQLRSDDRAVWLQLVLWRQISTKDPLEFASLSFLKELGWGHSRQDLQRLHICLERLQATSVRIREGKHAALSRSLLKQCEWRSSPGGQSGRWKVWLDGELAKHFEPLLVAPPRQAA